MDYARDWREEFDEVEFQRQHSHHSYQPPRH